MAFLDFFYAGQNQSLKFLRQVFFEGLLVKSSNAKTLAINLVKSNP